MRLLVTTDQWFPDFKGGSARVATETAKALAARGHEVTVLAPKHPGAGAARDENGLSVHRALPRGRLPQTFSDPAHTARWARRLRHLGFDAAVCHQPSNLVGLLAARLGVPTTLVFHASAPRELRYLAQTAPRRARRISAQLMARPLGLLEALATRQAGTILVLSEFSRSLVEADHPVAAHKVRVVTGGVDTDAFSPGDGRDAARRRLGLEQAGTILFTVRRLEPRMGLELVLEALPRLRHPDVRLAIAGSGMLETELRSRIAALDLGERVDLLGFVAEADLRDWYGAADLFVLPTVAYEGFGMATLEALACGTPVVGTAVGATPELLEPLDASFIAAEPTPERLAGTIDLALDRIGPELRAACRGYAVSRYDWPRAVVPWEASLERDVTTRQPSRSEMPP